MDKNEHPSEEGKSTNISLRELKDKAKNSNDIDALKALSDHNLKHWILLGFFVCSSMGLASGSIKFYNSTSPESTRESAGLITTIMSGITGIAAGVFTGSALR